MSSSPFRLRPFQRRVFDFLMRGRSVIVQAPTGSGKTKAALIPFVQNLAQGGNALPLTCRYAVPQRVLANQFYQEWTDICEQIGNQAHWHLTDIYEQAGLPLTALQTGEQPDDPQWEAALTFCTIDQLLASFLAVPYGLGTNKANLTVAGVLSSYLILDEFHLYPLLRGAQSVFGARTTTIQMLRLLRSITPFVLMTATFSTSLLQQLQALLDAEVVTVEDEEELRDIAQGRARVFQRVPTPMDAEAILADHRQRTHNRCTLVVCNTVGRAQQLFLQLKQAQEQGTRVILLHSRFSAQDRRQLSEEVEQALGPEQWKDGKYQGPDLIVIATQVIEVGLNISASVLHSEIAPANSLIQRAGRCARFAGQQGSVLVYPLPLNKEGKPARTLPYDQDTCDDTWQALEPFDGKLVGFPEEQQLIDAVHTAEDLKLLERYMQNEGEIRRQIFESLTTNHRGITSTLIRDVAQVQILIHDHPDVAIQEAPWRWQSFGMHMASFANAQRWEALQEKGKDLDWVCKEAVPIMEKPQEEDALDNRQQMRYTWQPVTSWEQIKQALVIALPRQLAHYDSELGFVLLDGQFELAPNDYQSQLLPEEPSNNRSMGSRPTSYQDHIRGLVKAYHAQLVYNTTFVAQRLEQAMNLPTGMIDQAIRLAIACHDLGKLNQSWQRWALDWQRFLYEMQRRSQYQLPHPEFCFAKTDYNYSRQQWEWQREVKPARPNHACESVMLGRWLIAASLGITRTEKAHLPVLRAICGAIARHHTAQASQYNMATLDARTLKAAEEALHAAHQGKAWSYDPALLKQSIADSGDLAPEVGSRPIITRPDGSEGSAGELEAWLYFVLVRTLRLADQRAG